MSSSALSSLQLGNHQLPNRVAFIATVNNLGHNLRITPEQIAFYEARAEGGAALVVTEGLSVHPTSIPNATVPLAYDTALVPGFTEMAEAVHRHDSLLLGQLWHVGRQALWNPSLQPWGPSGERDPYSGTTPHRMSVEEIDEVVDGFARAAGNLARAGFDGVELHGAHGYLITQFLSPSANDRRDEYGGSTENRTRFLQRIVRAVRAVTGPNFIVGLKLTAHEYVEGGIDLAETQAIVRLLGEHAPVDFLAVSQANFSRSLEYHVPDMTFDDVPFAHLVGGVREVADGVPVMAVAKVPDIETADRLLDAGTADMVGMSRAWVADSALVNKARAGHVARPCTYCNICWEFIHSSRTIACMYAPATGRELEVSDPIPLSGERRREVHVVGAGLAGLELARTAALLGHEVHVHEAEDEVGGRAAFEATIPRREEMGKAPRWLAQAARGAGASIHTDNRVDDAMVATWPEDAVVVFAGGADPVVAPLDGAEPISLVEVWRRRDEIAGPITIIDEIEDEPVYAIATALSEQGHDVTLVTRREMIARRVAFVSRIGTHRRLDEAGVITHVGLVPVQVVDGELEAMHVYSDRPRSLGPVGTVVRAGPSQASTPPDTGGRAVVVVGDASAPRSYVAVTHEANRLAHSLADLPVAEVTR